MKYTFKILRTLSRHTWWWTAGLIVLLAVALTSARLLLPQLDNYRQQLEVEASAAVGQPVAIGDLKVEWHGLGPRLVLRNVQLFDHSGTQALLGFARAYIDISVPSSLYQRQLEFGDLTLEGVVVNVLRRSDGHYVLEGVNLPQQELEGDTSAALKWLLRQPRLVLKDSLVRWRSESSGAHLEFKRVNLRLYNDGDRHRLGGEVVLPETMGGALTMRIDAVGDTERPEALQVNFYFKGAQLRLAQWLVDRPALGMHVVNGTADIELWGLWQQQQLRQLRGVLGMQDFYLAREAAAGSDNAAADVTVKLLPSLAGRFVWQGDGAAWQLEMDRLQLGSDWAPARVHVAQWLREGERSLEIASTFARLQTLAELGLNSALLPPELQQQLAQLRPRGELHDVYLKLKLKPDQPAEYFARARAGDFGVNPWRDLPGVDGVDLQLNLDQDGGVIDLASAGANLDTQGLFRDLLPLDTLQGQVAWQHSAAGWNLDLRQIDVANNDLEAALNGRVDLPQDGSSPRVDLQAKIRRGNGAATARYLPVRIMDEKTVAWLDRGIVAGQVSDGALVLQGPIRQFPFSDGSGRFEIGFKVSDGIVDYAAGWPRLEQVAADVTFAGKSMRIHGRSGKVLASDIKDVKVGIADFGADPAHLTLAGETGGATADLLRFLERSPLRQQFGQLANGSEASGLSHLGLNLDIPLAGAAPITTSGWVSFANSAIDMKRFGVDLAAINGRMEFTDHSLNADKIAAEVLGQPVQLTISTAAEPPGKGSIIFEARGMSHLQALAQRIDLPFFSYLKGESPWQGRFEIPRTGASPALRVVSQLDGTAVMLPEGLGKAAKLQRPLELSAEFGDKSTLWRFDYGQALLSGIFEELPGDAGAHLNRAELRLGQTAQLPPTPGFRVAGVMDHFDYETWRPILFADTGKSALHNGGQKKGGASAVSELDLGINSALIYGQPLTQVKLQARRLPAAWSAQVESQELGGKITLPDDVKSPLEMDLSHLYLTAAGSDADKNRAAGAQAKSGNSTIDPRDLPPLRIRSADTRYGKAALGGMELVTVPRANGMGIESLRLDSAVASIKLQGAWVVEGNGKQSSLVNGALDIHDLGSLLSDFGYVETVKNGKGSSTVNLRWNGPLTEPSVAQLEGTVKFDLKDGRLLEVDPGAGRLFGLLSVQALPRRLTLDFSDFFGKGLAFDTMSGRFDFKDGNAVTKDFTLDGPSAKVTLQGRVGLVARDYDQQLNVMPHFTSTLTLAGAVAAGVSVGVGAAVLLAEKLLQSNIDRVTGVRYYVTGSWDAPVMERMQK